MPRSSPNSPPRPLTPRQREVLHFIQMSIADRGFPPTIAEIAAHFDMKSPNAAAQHLKLISQKGAIQIEAGVSRGIRMLETNNASLPIVGRVAAGSPILAEENLEGSLAIDAAAFKPRADYLLRVAGDSMIEEGIFNGDLAAVHKTMEAANGKIAIVRIDGEATVKLVQRRGRILTLIPANHKLKPREVDLTKEDVAIEGVVVGVVRVRL